MGMSSKLQSYREGGHVPSDKDPWEWSIRERARKCIHVCPYTSTHRNHGPSFGDVRFGLYLFRCPRGAVKPAVYKKV